MFASSSLCPVHQPTSAFPASSLPQLSTGSALDRLQPLQALAAPSAITSQFEQLLQGQQLLQLMGLLLTLMQNRGSNDSSSATSAPPTPVGDSSSKAASQGTEKAGGAKAGSGDGSTVMRQGKPIGAHIAKQFDDMVAAAKKDGINITISSGARSRAEQERLYAAYKNGTGNLAAKPGTSNHESGDALDLGPPAAYAWLKSNAGKFGFKNKIASEPWHWSLTGH